MAALPSAPIPTPIRLVDLAAQYKRLQDEIESAALRVLRSGRYVLGPEVAAFEAELAAYCGVRHAVACALGGPGRRTLYMATSITSTETLARIHRLDGTYADELASDAVGWIEAATVEVPGAGWPCWMTQLPHSFPPSGR